jgi:alanine dehydrogenase
MALFLTEADVRSILTMPLAMEAVEDCFLRLAAASSTNQPRRRLHFAEKGVLHYMAASDGEAGYFGMKIYSTSPNGARFIVPLYRTQTGELVAIIEAEYLGMVRTGAASGVATRYMARRDSHTLGVIGTGSQASTQLEAVTLARKFDTIRSFSRDKNRREAFAEEMSKKLGFTITPVDSAEAAVRGSDVVVTITSSVKPVVDGKWLEPGVHINAVGSNWPQKAELDRKAVLWCDVIAADSLEQARIEAGDLIQAFDGDESKWEQVRELSQIVAGKIKARSDDREITLFKSVGLAAEDIATAARVYELARETSIGREVPMWEPKTSEAK